MTYGFVIDNRRCIGCHACTIACKAEHQVPLGDFRTWVKSVEKGIFPSVRRHFTVLRCNHCADAPCVNICPTKALFHRSNGIVDFDSKYCLGCRACIAACPYDSIYIDYRTSTAAKCNFCAHRIEVGMEPPCATVCPTQAIIAGDVDRQGSAPNQLIAAYPAEVRKPEYGTRPGVFYIESDPALLVPESFKKGPGYAWAERPRDEAEREFSPEPGLELALVTYDAPHKLPWGLGISLYLWAKSIAAGIILVASVLGLFHIAHAPQLLGIVAPAVALAFVALTIIVLIADLGRPGRFLLLLFHPNWSSWLVWGADILLGFSLIAFLWLAAGLLGLRRILELMLWPGLITSAMTAIYSAFLLAQARARDLWRSPLLVPHLLAQAFLAGSAGLVICANHYGSGAVLSGFLSRCLMSALCAHGVLIIGDIWIKGRNRRAAEAKRYLIQGPLALGFWAGAIFAGVAAPLLLLVLGITGVLSNPVIPMIAAAGSLAGLLVYEHLYIRAGQALPLS
jgi:Fe-S-cluster-containing dehydrogenase component/formate-dependent nitrite reductase membrane component NrfD